MNYLYGDYSFGDYSFINDNSKRQYLKYDFNIINSWGNNGWKCLKDHKLNTPYELNVNLKLITDKLYPGHTSVTYKNSLNDLEYISKNGWNNYVESNLKINKYNKNETYLLILILIIFHSLIIIIIINVKFYFGL